MSPFDVLIVLLHFFFFLFVLLLLAQLDGCVIGEEIAYGCSGIGTAIEANTLAQMPVILGELLLLGN